MMKLLFENFRKFLRPINEVEDEKTNFDITLENAGYPKEWILTDRLGKGAYGVVYTIENQKTGERRAAKFLSGDDSKEFENYKWVKDNYDSLPKEVSKFLPVVYDIYAPTERKYPFFGFIIMEQLIKPPKEELKTLVLPPQSIHTRMGEPSKRITDLLQNPEFVYEVLDTLLYNIFFILDLQSNVVIQQQGLSGFANKSGSLGNDGEQKKPRAKKLKKQDLYDLIDKLKQEIIRDFMISSNDIKNKNRLEQLAIIVAKIISPYVPEEKEWKFKLKELAIEYIKDELNISVLPLSTIDSSWSHKQVPRKYQKKFTEAEGILKAIKYLKGKNFYASDLHGENIMMRPNTNEFVIVDLGLFSLGEYSSGEDVETISKIPQTTISNSSVINEYVVPMGYSLTAWKSYKKKNNITNSEFHEQKKNRKWKVVHGHKEGSIGKPINDKAKNLSYDKANKMHSAIAINKTK
jgi:serine/threonine protein kinase